MIQISLKGLEIDNLGITFIKPPNCTCGDLEGNCSKFVFKSHDEIFGSMHKILGDIKNPNCIGITFKSDGTVLIADKLLDSSKIVTYEEFLPKIKYLLQILSVNFAIIFVEVETNKFKVLHSDKEIYTMDSKSSPKLRFN